MGSMIKNLHIHNYKCLVNFDLELQGISLLLGGNGVGMIEEDPKGVKGLRLSELVARGWE